jgi:hypothetical protein
MSESNTNPSALPEHIGQTIEVKLVGQAIASQQGGAALIVDGQDRSDIDDFKGRSQTRRLPDGRIEITIQGSPHWGRRNEHLVLKVLRQAISREIGAEVATTRRHLSRTLAALTASSTCPASGVSACRSWPFLRSPPMPRALRKGIAESYWPLRKRLPGSVRRSGTKKGASWRPIAARWSSRSTFVTPAC